jgi:hypothetical protein
MFFAFLSLSPYLSPLLDLPIPHYPCLQGWLLLGLTRALLVRYSLIACQNTSDYASGKHGLCSMVYSSHITNNSLLDLLVGYSMSIHLDRGFDFCITENYPGSEPSVTREY